MLLYCRNPSFPDIKLAQAAILCHTIANFIQQQQQQQWLQPPTAEHQQGSSRGSNGRQQHTAADCNQQSAHSSHSHQQLEQQQQPHQRAPVRQQQQQQLDSIGSMPVVVGGDFNSLWQKYSSDVWDRVSGPGCVVLEGTAGKAACGTPAVLLGSCWGKAQRPDVELGHYIVHIWCGSGPSRWLSRAGILLGLHYTISGFREPCSQGCWC